MPLPVPAELCFENFSCRRLQIKALYTCGNEGESARTEGAEAFYEARIIPQVPQVLIALAGGGAIFALESCVFSRFWNRFKVLEDKFVLT